MANRNNLSRALKRYLGRVTYGKYQSGSPGIEFTASYRYKVVAALAVSTDVAASQSVGAAASFVINGARATAGVATLDQPRNVVAAWTTTSVLTITGTDVYGAVMIENSASGTSHTGKKAFKTITSVTSTASITSATIGSGSVLGLPFRADTGDVLAVRFNNAIDAATIVAADTTSPATATTGDVRGTLAPAGTLDGAKTLTALLVVSDDSTTVGSFGVTQFGS